MFSTWVSLQNLNFHLTFHSGIFPTKAYYFFPHEEICHLLSVSMAAHPHASFQIDNLTPEEAMLSLESTFRYTTYFKCFVLFYYKHF